MTDNSKNREVGELIEKEIPAIACQNCDNFEENEEPYEVGEDDIFEHPPIIDDAGETELFEHHAIIVDNGQTPIRIDKFLTNRLENATRNRIQSAAESGSILVDGVAVKSSYKVKAGDKITIVMPYPPRKLEIIAEDIPLNIIYEDDDIIIVNKNPGMVVHPGHGNYSGTLVNALTYHLKDLPLYQSGDLRAGLVHRIDKDTSGLLVVAKNEKSHTFLAKQFFDHSIERRYVALVWGDFKEETGTIIGNIGRSLHDRMQMAVFSEESGIGKRAVTHYKVLESLGYLTLVECRLETGRTHQIRAHFKSIGHPLFNDARYGGHLILRGTTFTKYKQFVNNSFALMPRQGLHARSLGFIHPTTGEKVHFESEIAPDMQACIEKWRGYVSGRDFEL
ncbi:MAG: RluA family pseudouridine synthase [Bacteroidetes bacterium]|nr:RluA family pseudouridine synthase [Bacteroidota bacterium]